MSDMTEKRKKLIILGIPIIIFIFLFISNHFHSKLPGEPPFKNKITFPLSWEKNFEHKITPYWDISQYGEIVCSNNSSKVYFINPLNGKTKKEILLSEDSSNMILKFNNNQIYGVVNNKDIYSINTEEKKVVKEIKNDKRILIFLNGQNIIVYKNNLIFWQDNGKVIVLNTKTGRKIKKRLFFSEVVEDVKVYNNMIYSSKNGFNIYAFEMKTLEEIWKYDIGHTHTGSKPVIIGEKMYLKVENDKRKILVFNPHNGDILNKYNIYVSFIFSDGKDLYGNGKEYVYKIDSDTGEIIWKYKEKAYEILFSNKYVYFQSSTKPVFYKLNKLTGNKVWKIDLFDITLNIKKVISTKKYDILEREDGAIFVLDKNTGEKLWKFKKTVDCDKQNWTVYNGILIISDGANKIYGYKLR